MKVKKSGNRKNLREVRRIVAASEHIEVRTNADGSRSISGQAVVYDALSQDLGGFREKISPGAFSKSLSEGNKDVLILVGHDNNNLLGRVASGTLKIEDTPIALRFTCKLPNTTTANDLIALLERRDLSAMSFGFRTVDDDWKQIGDEVIRIVNEAILYEISVVGQPAYLQSSVNLRSCPTDIRKKLKQDADDLDLDDDDDDDDIEDRDCSCECAECLDGECQNCSDLACDSDDCHDCPAQQRSAHFDLILRRLRA